MLVAIFTGNLTPNDKLLPEKELQQIFGVSRVTVLVAIQSLEQFGVIEVRQGSHGGSFVKKVDLDAVLSQKKTPLK